jgi:hypothetical protein
LEKIGPDSVSGRLEGIRMAGSFRRFRPQLWNLFAFALMASDLLFEVQGNRYRTSQHFDRKWKRILKEYLRPKQKKFVA